MRTLFSGAAIGLLLATSAAKAAEPTVDITPEYIANIAKGYGSAVIDKLSDGKPVVIGRIEGTRYLVFLIDCQEKPSCALIQFGASFPVGKTTLDKINSWNREKRFGKVNLNKDQIWVMQPVVTAEGIPQKTLERYFAFWKLVLKDLPAFLAAE